MTSCAMIAGMLPMALAFGEAGQQNAPLGRAVIGGLSAPRWHVIRAAELFSMVQSRVSPRRPRSIPTDPHSSHYRRTADASTAVV